MNSTYRSIRTTADAVWTNIVLKNRLNAELKSAAEEVDCLHDELPFSRIRQLHPARLHADFTRMLRGERESFAETATALGKMQEALNRVGFIPGRGSRLVASEPWRLTGEMDAAGVINDWVPCILELKVVDYIPQFVRAADAVQLLLYSISKHAGLVGGAALCALYVQPVHPFRAELRYIFNPERVFPLIRPLIA